jgi:antitoxin Phd
MLTMTSVEAQNRFGQLLDAAQREPIAITRHGRVVAFVISPQDMKELTDPSIVGSKVVADFEAWQLKTIAR